MNASVSKRLCAGIVITLLGLGLSACSGGSNEELSEESRGQSKGQGTVAAQSLQFSQQVPTSAPMPVYRWWQPTDKDWISVPRGGDEPTDQQMNSYGYEPNKPDPQGPVEIQFYAYLTKTENMVAVYRWWNPTTKDWVTTPEDEVVESQLVASGYSQKKFQFFAHRTQVPGTVPVYRWWHEGDGDWITLAEGERSDAFMLGNGYTKWPYVLFYVFRNKPTASGYFSLGSPSPVFTTPPWNNGEPVHTMSVIKQSNSRGATNFNYLGYYGLVECGGVGIARSNDLQSWSSDSTAVMVPNPSGSGMVPLYGARWPSVLKVATANNTNTVYMAHTVNFCPSQASSHIVLRQSTDNGETFSNPTDLVVEEPGNRNQNPALFYDSASGRYYLYWFRQANSQWEIRVKSASTVSGLTSVSTANSQVIALAPITLAAPQVILYGGKYYLAVETWENKYENNATSKVWMTRILTSDKPDQGFVEIPGNPILDNGSACFFQHVFKDSNNNDKLHAYFCKQTAGIWELDYLNANL